MKSDSSRKVLEVVQSHVNESGLGVGRESTSRSLDRAVLGFHIIYTLVIVPQAFSGALNEQVAELEGTSARHSTS